MAKRVPQISIPDEVIMSKIYLIRGKKVMLDRDLAELYEVETKQLKRAVRRNMDRFPDDFMFELSKTELAEWRSQFGTSNSETMGLRVSPFVFTEHGVIMLASILNSDKAIKVNLQIVRICVVRVSTLTLTLTLFHAPQAGSASRNFLTSFVKLSSRPVFVNKKAIICMMAPVSLRSPDC